MPIKGYEQLYSATTCGKIWSHRNNRFLKQQLCKNGYPYVQLSYKGQIKNSTIHSLVLYSHMSSIGSFEINHLDGDKLNNDLSNLELVTRKENNVHARKFGLTSQNGEDGSNSKLSKGDVLHIRKALNLSSRDLAKLYPVSSRTIRAIRARKTWRHI